ncbi:MAG: 2,4-diketo-3-deoxy-L-fuconate hydrolase [Myxococcota bacterium]|jgi:2,4-diketo-3-deoxy-L-fuconate hydrolase
MKSVINVLLGVVIVAAIATFVTWQMSRPIFDVQLTSEDLDVVEIAPIESALTFARTKSGDVLLVLRANGSEVVGVKIKSGTSTPHRDAIDAYNAIGAEAFVGLAQNGAQQTYAWADLAVPTEETYPHVAAGTNYSSHAAEVGHEGDPFLFPKLSKVTGWNDDVINGGRLDYEVEICAAPLTDHTSANPAKLGYVLCGDFTDRWSLIKHIDLDGPMGPTGFPNGKAGETRLPVGALFVIPNDHEFYKSLDVKLYVNDELRQQASAALMIWSPNEILSRTLADCETPYKLDDSFIRIADCDVIPARTFILTGTPEGVIFKVPTIWNPLAYLRPGDVVISTGKYLGFMRNEIVRN